MRDCTQSDTTSGIVHNHTHNSTATVLVTSTELGCLQMGPKCISEEHVEPRLLGPEVDAPGCFGSVSHWL